ncbi:error-prone DNA polymerase [Marinobacteraceae bacterium S3BR75-40.1]
MAGLPEQQVPYAELHCLSNFSFLRGASHPEELVERAQELGYRALALTDECSVAGVVRAYRVARERTIKLIIGSQFQLENLPGTLILLVTDRRSYAQLCRLITLARRRAEKGQYCLRREDLNPHALDHCLGLWRPDATFSEAEAHGQWLQTVFPQRLWLLGERLLEAGEAAWLTSLRQLAEQLELPVTAAGDVHMHSGARQPLQDALTAIRHNCSVAQASGLLFPNAERRLRSFDRLQKLYPSAWLAESVKIAERCGFSLGELRYDYPAGLVPQGRCPQSWLRQLVREGEQRRFPEGTPETVSRQIEHELSLIAELRYEPYFLTIHDIVRFARQRGILCQGRGSAANSVVCYCLGITEVDPREVSLLFERFISKNRNEPPDIDVDFEHERREEVIQYIYRNYGRDHAALAATVICYRPRSAIRDVGKALGLDPAHIEQMLGDIDWRDREQGWHHQLSAHSHGDHARVYRQFLALVETLIGFPRHLSQHVGGFVISATPVHELVPVENAAMADRTVIQWDKDDLESLGLLKVDVLALGMLSAIRKALDAIGEHRGHPFAIQDIPREDPAVYQMLQKGDSVGVFQVESRAQMSMLPRLKPECYYDLVIEVAIVRPGPIQGDMVHPYLRRRAGLEEPTYPSEAVREVLERTLGVPIFQEQAIRLAMVAAGFSAGEADQLRRAMATWKLHGTLKGFRDKLIAGMLERGYSRQFAERLYRELSGFSGYGFPESHSASFALLVYVSAWLKRHEPAAFLCALLNSQPMGFYSPSQLVQDARRHDIIVRPVDINASEWDHTLEAAAPEGQPPVRLGFRLIKGLSREGMQQLLAARRHGHFRSLDDLRRRVDLNARDLEALAGADAFVSLAGHRYQARWDVMGFEAPLPLESVREAPAAYTADARLSAPSCVDNLLEDYHSTGLTLGEHPLALLRSQGWLRHCRTATALADVPHGRPAVVAGLVTGRQRPGSASGVTFVTLEDETGNINLVVWLATARRQRKPLLTARLLQVHGTVEREGDVIHVIAGRLSDISHLLDSLHVKARNFH